MAGSRCPWPAGSFALSGLRRPRWRVSRIRDDHKPVRGSRSSSVDAQRRATLWVEPRRPARGWGMAGIGASRPLQRIPAVVSFLNAQPTLSLGGWNRSSAPLRTLPGRTHGSAGCPKPSLGVEAPERSVAALPRCRGTPLLTAQVAPFQSGIESGLEMAPPPSVHRRLSAPGRPSPPSSPPLALSLPSRAE